MKVVAVAGNIGAGKSTAVAGLAEADGIPAIVERWEKNPWLDDAVRAPSQWTFHSQCWFVEEAARNALRRRQGAIIQERWLGEHRVFQRFHRDRGNLSADEYATLAGLTSALEYSVPAPALVVWLHAHPRTLLRRIQQRGRPFEQALRLADLAQLEDYYRRWLSDFPSVLAVDTEQEDVRSPQVVRALAQRIKQVLNE